LQLKASNVSYLLNTQKTELIGYFPHQAQIKEAATGCSRYKCTIKAQLVEIFVERRQWSKRLENAIFSWDFAP
jgi:hypothetical protein